MVESSGRAKVAQALYEKDTRRVVRESEWADLSGRDRHDWLELADAAIEVINAERERGMYAEVATGPEQHVTRDDLLDARSSGSAAQDHEGLEAIGEYLAMYPPSGFTDRYSAEGWAHIAHGVLSAASVFARSSGCARSPQGEDHEAGIEAMLRVGPWRGLSDAERHSTYRHNQAEEAIAAYLSRVSAPERD